MATEADYGTWKSPITSDAVSRAGVSLYDLTVDQIPAAATSGDGADSAMVYWVEARPAEGGRYVVCSASGASADVASWTPAGMSARTRVHEYGGGALLVYNGVVYFSNMSDQRLYRQERPDGPAEPVTPEGEYFYADGCHGNGRLYYVREDHEAVKSGSLSEAENCLVAVCPAGGRPPAVVASGRDFYASPRVSPDGGWIAWIQWDHPNMPWDSTQLCWAQLDRDTGLIVEGSTRVVAPPPPPPGDGPTGDEVNFQYAGWASDTRLLYICDQSGYWNLYSTDVAGEEGSSGHANLFPASQDLASPAWMFAQQPYCMDGQGRVLLVSGDTVLRLDPGSDGEPLARFKLAGRTSIKYPRFAGGRFYAIASSGQSPPAVVRCCLETGSVETLRESSSVIFDEGYISVAQSIEFPTADGATAHAYYYPPKNRDYAAPPGARPPPLLVRAHGGPTSAASPALNLRIQYWTSRGYALADVDYRGSTGYGTAYRNLLRYSWGLADVDDCCAVVRHLAGLGLADPDRACIDGGSAGGYTTLACLAFRDTFRAGASHYGVADLALLMEDTHKFESRYMDGLIGRTEEERRQACLERSPIHHVGRISCPLVLFQGDEDRIVPPNQAELMFARVRDKGLPCAYLLFPGEQHGFRKAENINKSLDGQFYFFARVFGFRPADTGIEIDIHNLPAA